MAVAASLFAAATVASTGQWCWAPPLEKGQAPLSAEGFRGSYRDLSLYFGSSLPAHCDAFQLEKGPTGLWVLELPTSEERREAVQRVSKAGVHVLLVLNNTVLAQGGERLPDRTGYDACGAERGVSVIPVPDHRVRIPQAANATLLTAVREGARRRNHKVQTAVQAVSEDELKKAVTSLQEYNSRNSYSKDAVTAQEWLVSQFESYGAKVSLFTFRDDMPPCVIAEFAGRDPDRIIVTGAHYDSRSTDNTSPTQRAPGADDNASGTSALLEIARIISKLGVTLDHTLRLIAFSGEEQGLLGSRALAQKWADEGVNVVTMFNADMLGYQIPDQPITLGFKDRSVSIETTEAVRELVGIYLPELPTGYSGSCCSDYLSFYENGFTAVGFFENKVAASSYPHYHRSTDLLQYINTKQLTLEVKALVATVFSFAHVVRIHRH
eukprot:Hpha_TRINITY_DN16367_c1_g9::TRINITY_DN16367_c1_g9_i1::g.62892::m.62892